MGRVLLDTTVVIDVLRRRPAVQQLADPASQRDLSFTSPVNVEELVRGLRPGEECAIELLLGGLRIVPLGREEAEFAGRWRRMLPRGAGR